VFARLVHVLLDFLQVLLSTPSAHVRGIEDFALRTSGNAPAMSST